MHVNLHTGICRLCRYIPRFFVSYVAMFHGLNCFFLHSHVHTFPHSLLSACAKDLKSLCSVGLCCRTSGSQRTSVVLCVFA